MINNWNDLPTYEYAVSNWYTRTASHGACSQPRSLTISACHFPGECSHPDAMILGSAVCVYRYAFIDLFRFQRKLGGFRASTLLTTCKWNLKRTVWLLMNKRLQIG